LLFYSARSLSSAALRSFVPPGLPRYTLHDEFISGTSPIYRSRSLRAIEATETAGIRNERMSLHLLLALFSRSHFDRFASVLAYNLQNSPEGAGFALLLPLFLSFALSLMVKFFYTTGAIFWHNFDAPFTRLSSRMRDGINCLRLTRLIIIISALALRFDKSQGPCEINARRKGSAREATTRT